MTHEQLRLFALAAETKNFSETARRLYLSQPTVSQQIKQLERQLGVLLFDRTGKELRLTSAGETLYPFALRVRQEIEAAEQAMRGLQGAVSGPLKLGASTTIGNYWLPRILTSFKGSYPLAEPSLVIENSAILLQRLHRGELHLLMVEGPRPTESAESTEASKKARFRVERFFEDRLILVASPALAFPHPLEFSELSRLPWILRESGSGTRDVLMQYLEAQGVAPLHAVLELGGSEAIKRAVELGAGIACLSSLAVEEELRTGRLREIQVNGWGICRPLWLVAPTDRYLNPVGRALLDFIPTMIAGVSKRHDP